jgi:stage II sporulation protein P
MLLLRSALQMKKRSLDIPLRPLISMVVILAVVWAAIRFDAAGVVGSALSEGLSGETALIMLRAETSAMTPNRPSNRTLLSFASPLLASLGNGKNTSEISVFPPQPQASPSQPPVLNPFLPSESSDFEIFSWDDRTWLKPDEGDPGASSVREVTLLPVGADGKYLTDGTVAVNNDTQYSIDIPSLLARAPKITAPSNGPQILIIHTHGSESFLPDERDFYIPTDIERTEDTRYNVVRLGDEMAERFEAMGLSVLHDRNIYDYPTYSGSYGRTLRAIEAIVRENPGIQIVFDIHRDSISQKDGTIFKTVCESSYGKTAQMMFVVGSNGTGLPHDGWRDNLAFAAQLQSRVLEDCPTAMRPIHLRKERFNQHAVPGSLILEIGTAANSLTEAIRAVHLFCDTAGEYLKELLLPPG